jgi:hypothetical protein
LGSDNITNENYSIQNLDPNIARYFSIGEISGGIVYVINSELSNIESQLTYLQNFITQMPTRPNSCQEKVTSLTSSVKKLRKITKELNLLIRHNENEPIRLNPFAEILDKVSILIEDRFKIHGVKFEIKNDRNININCREYEVIQALVALLGVCYSHVHNEKDAWVKVIGSSSDKEVIIEIHESHKKSDFISSPVFNAIAVLIASNLGKIDTIFESNKPLFIIIFPIVENPYLVGFGCEK